MADERRKADIRTLENLLIGVEEQGEDLVLVLKDGTERQQRQALARQLPAMLAALRFVEEHGETLRFSRTKELKPGAHDALAEALAALRKP